MEYGLLSTEASFAFLLVLTMIYFSKQQYKSSRTTCYKVFLVTSMVFQLVLFISVCLIKYFDVNIFTRYMWRIQYILMFISWNLFILYGYVSIKNIEETSFIKIIKSDKQITSLFIAPFIIAIVLLLPIEYKIIDCITPTNMIYYKPKMAIFLLVLSVLSVLSYVVDIYKNKEKLSKEFKFMNLVAIVLICTINIFHMIYAGLTFYPLAFSLIAYTIYFCIENPDIIMMNEIQRMQKENNEELNQSDNFLVNVDENILGIVNQISILSDENLKNISNREDINKRLNEIKKQGTILVEKMTEILDVSQYQTEIRKIEDRKYETKELIKRVILYAQDKIKDKKLKLIFNINPNISSKLYGDIEKINQVIENVINYSTENTKVGRITISISSNKIENFEQITIKIVDTGEGINSEDMRNLFNENKTKFKSLFLSKKTIDLLEGKMWCESQFKVGTKVYIQIKQKIADTNPLGDISKINEETIVNITDIDYSKYKILLVDDNMINNKLTKRILEEKQFNVEIVCSGEECIRKIKAEEEIDLIFMDIMMPVMDGVETLKVIRDLDGYVLPPIIALTANALPGMKENYLSEGFDDYLSKPLNTKELEKVLRQHLLKEKKEEKQN